MKPLREQLGRFIGELRQAGVRISIAESLDAMNAVVAAGIDRSRLREALAATLIKDESDRATFDSAFERFFAAPPGRESKRRHPDHVGMAESAATGRGRPGENPPPREATPSKSRDARKSRENPSKAAHDADENTGRKEQGQTAASNQPDGEAQEHRGKDEPGENEKLEGQEGIGAHIARQSRIERMSFDAYTDREYEEAREELKPLERKFRIRLGRRLQMAPAGRIDFRRTIRAAIQHGGALADLRFRSRRPRHVDLLILADVSGSVRYAAELMLELIAGARSCFRRVRSFVYIERLAEAEFEQGHLVTTPALDEYARSDFGKVLTELWSRREELVNRQTLMVIMGDGRNNRRPHRADLLREITRLSRGVVWLNPEDPARWGTGDSAIAQYQREVTATFASRSLRELSRALCSAV